MTPGTYLVRGALDNAQYVYNHERRRHDLIGLQVMTYSIDGEVKGKTVDAIDPPKDAQGVGIDVQVQFPDRTVWMDAGDLDWLEGPFFEPH